MELPEKGTGVRHLIFSADGKRLVCGGNDGFVTVWEYPGKKQVQRFQASPQAVNQMELAPDGKTLAVSTQVISLWDAEAGKALVDPPGHASQIAQIAFGADRDRVLTGSNDGTVRLWSVEEARDPRKSGEAKVHRQRYRMAALSKDGALLALCGFDKTVKLLEAESGKEGAKLENLPGFPTALCFSPDGGRLAVASSNKQVHLYETKTGKKLADVAAPGQNVGSLAYAPDGSLFITASYDGAVGFFEAATGEAVCEYTLGRLSPNCLALSPDSRLLVTMGLGDGNNPLRAGAAGNGKAEGGQPGVRIVELASGQDVLLLQTPAPYQTGLAFLPGGKVLATAGMDGALRFWNMATGAELAKLEASPSDPAEDKELERLQAAGPAAVKMAMSRQFGKNRILCMAASADGTRLATGHQDTTALVWATPEAVLKAALPETAGDEEALKGLWGELSGEAGAAWAAVWKLAAGGEGAAKFLGRMLELAPPPEGELGQLLAQLDSDDVNQRDEASKKLELLGRAAESALRKAAEASESLEIKNRAKAVLAALESPTPSSPDLLRRARALAALERNGTPAAREILSRLAAGASESREARDAQGAMKRLGAAGDDKKE
ncbi:MAG: PQQ-binding-like beta-propeller repeat protein [Planctomycetota bacterium]|nr:PQQ-binding-like beta-propeller repeat protein [Planctomycetota bacterium]